MRARFNTAWAVARETLLAVLVLSLVFLNYGTTEAGVAIDGSTVVAQTISVCGDPASGGDNGHVVCHACRPSIPVLPPPPQGSVDACLESVAVVYAPYVAVAASAPRFAGASQRGPPVIA